MYRSSVHLLAQLFTLLVACLPIAGRSLAVAAEPAWKSVAVPDDWKKAPVGEKGFLWYRTKVAIPAAWQGRKFELVVEAIDDAREIYFGGQLLGRLGEFPPQYRSALGETEHLTVPVAAVTFGGDNVVA